MKIRWRILGGEWREVETSAKTVGELMSELGISYEEYLPSRNGKLVTPDDEINESDEITFVPVVSGG
ncbi:MAG: ThiS family [Candidatus Diapherotrites archaeon]|nr:ThiS family [Candidatus Diapherotrites archaeon]